MRKGYGLCRGVMNEERVGLCSGVMNEEMNVGKGRIM